MGHKLSKEQIEKFEKYLKAAEPYTQQELAEMELDSDEGYNFARMRSTTAKMLLDQYYTEHGGKPEGEKDT